MFNPGLLQKSYNPSIPLIRNSTHIVIDNIQNNKSKWDQPIEIPPVLYSKFGVPIPGTIMANIKQVKSYPKSLLDYIKRAYEKCKDDNQKLIMEKLLRDIVRNFENDFNQVSWDTYPLPIIQQDGTARRDPIVVPRQEEKVVVPPNRSRLNEIRLPSSYNIVEEEVPSKALAIAKKRMEKIQQKLNRENKDNQQKPKKEVFIGFTSAPVPAAKVEPRFTSFPSSIVTSVPIKPPTLTPTPTIGSTMKQSIPPTVLKYQINDKPIERNREKEKEREREREREKEREKERERQKERQKEKQREKQRQKEKERQKQKQRQKQKEKQAEKEKTKAKASTTKQDARNPQNVTKRELQLLQKLKQNDQNIDQVARRFKDFHKLKADNYQRDAIEEADDNIDFEQVIVGKNQSIEKPYLRITGRPNPDTVRPQPVLRKALPHFLDKYTHDHNYEYLISQLRSIRQDLTVQHIKNAFTVRVYEENLEISLYEKDIPQFKHCQTTLWQLYCQGLYWTNESRIKFISHQMVTLIMEEKSQEMEFMLTKIPEGALEHPEIQSCLRLKQQLIVGNYAGFFAYFTRQPKFIGCLLELYLDKMLVKFLLVMCKTCGEKVPIKQLCKLVGQYGKKLEQTIRSENGITLNGYLMLKPSHEQFLKSEHLATKKVTVLLS